MTTLNILKIIIENIKNKENVLNQNIDLKIISNFFKKVKTDKNKFNYAYLNYYLYNNISNEIVAKRKTTSRDFEDIIATIFDGSITDENKRENINIENFILENETITGFAISNKREKADIKIGKDYLVSIKTLMNSNKEINFGSFEKTTLFSGFHIERYLNERKGISGEKIGLGSKVRLFNLLKKIEKDNLYSKFQIRFNKLIKFVFADDLVILIKNNKKVDLYFIEGKQFIKLLINKSNSPEELTSIINRWEGNSIRMNRVPILEIGKKISLDFNFLERHIINKILETEKQISTYFIKYVNSYPNNAIYKELIFEECNKILKNIDTNINDLI